jgi:hypothetical protein
MSKIPASDTTKSIVGHGLWLKKNINGEKSGVYRDIHGWGIIGDASRPPATGPISERA